MEPNENIETKKIVTGATVKLKSGGPLMTVDRIMQNKAFCIWFDDKKVIDRLFDINNLVIAE